MMKENFGRNLKYQRKRRELTQEEAAELCELSPKYWGKLERGEAAATVDTLEKIAMAMGMSVGDLLEDSGTKDAD